LADRSGRLKRFSLELGGHAPGIVLPGADIDRVVDGVVISKFRNAGQSCIALNRLYVHRSIYSEVIDRVVARAAQLKVGDPMDPSTDVGPLIDEAAVEKLDGQVRDALSAGATLLTGGGRSSQESTRPGTYFAPAVIADVPDGSSLISDEIFGPVLPVFPFDDIDDVIDRA